MCIRLSAQQFDLTRAEAAARRGDGRDGAETEPGLSRDWAASLESPRHNGWCEHLRMPLNYTEVCLSCCCCCCHKRFSCNSKPDHPPPLLGTSPRLAVQGWDVNWYAASAAAASRVTETKSPSCTRWVVMQKLIATRLQLTNTAQQHTLCNTQHTLPYAANKSANISAIIQSVSDPLARTQVPSCWRRHSRLEHALPIARIACSIELKYELGA